MCPTPRCRSEGTPGGAGNPPKPGPLQRSSIRCPRRPRLRDQRHDNRNRRRRIQVRNAFAIPAHFIPNPREVKCFIMYSALSFRPSPLWSGVWVTSWSRNCPHCMSMRVKSGLGRLRSAIKASLIALGEGKVDLDSAIWPRGTDTPARWQLLIVMCGRDLRRPCVQLTVFVFGIEQSLESHVGHSPVRVPPVVARAVDGAKFLVRRAASPSARGVTPLVVVDDAVAHVFVCGGAGLGLQRSADEREHG